MERAAPRRGPAPDAAPSPRRASAQLPPAPLAAPLPIGAPPRAASVTLAIFDAAGRRVRVLVDGVSTAGKHAQAWDLRDEGGRAVGAGLYIARLDAEDRTLTRRVMALRWSEPPAGRITGRGVRCAAARRMHRVRRDSARASTVSPWE